MNNEIIKSIHDAETNADSIVAQARAQAKEIRAGSQSKSEAARNAVIQEARSKSSEAMKAAKLEGQAEVDRYLEENRAEGEALKAAARGKLTEARDYIVGRIVN